MKRKYFIIRQLALLVLLASLSQLLLADPLAFPGAEGAAKYLTGGRGGDVYHVTNLNWDGPGSLQYGFDSKSSGTPRTIVFDVSGYIGCSNPTVPGYTGCPGCNGSEDEMTFHGDDITVAGQTAPGKGITIRDHNVEIIGSSNLIVRYLRMRLGDEYKGMSTGDDAITANDNDGLMLDHLSVSWGIDGEMDSRRCGKFTTQWCIFAEPLHDSIHYEGSPHGYLMSWRDQNDDYSIHHNLFSSGSTRHPTLGANDLVDRDYVSDFRNNVNYNWGGGNMKIGSTNHNIVNNYFRYGPNGIGEDEMLAIQNNYPTPWGYLTGNVWDSIFSIDAFNCASFTLDNYNACHYTYAEGATRSDFEAFSEFSIAGISSPTTESADDALRSVLANAGCSLMRDTVDIRMVNDVKNSTAYLDGHTYGMIDSQNDVGGWDPYTGQTRPADFDTDRDGMADDWEVARGLDPGDPGDRNYDRDEDGYTNLEEYLHWLTFSQIVGVQVDDPIAHEIDDDTATFTVTRQGSTVDYLPVYVTLGGDAVYLEDYTVSGTIYAYHGNKAFVNIPPGQSSASFMVHPTNDFVFEGSESIEVTVEPDQSINYTLGNTTVVTGHIYDISGTDLRDFAVLSRFWQSSCGSDTECQDVDFDGSGDIGFVDLQKFAMRWLSEKGEVNPPPPPFDPVLINFQPDDSTVPDGYLMDAGYIYGDRGNGQTYGWDGDVSGDSRDRGEHSDQRYDTLIHMEKSGNRYWELEIPNGDYVVDLVMGDADNTDQTNDVSVEGVVIDDPDGEDKFDEYFDVRVTVTDGRLTVSAPSSGDNAKICFIEIR